MSRYFKRLRDGIHLLAQSIRILIAHPKFLVPLLFCWMTYAPLLLYLVYFHPWAQLSMSTVLLSVFAAVFLFAFVLTLSCHVLLEMIQQIESGQPVSLTKATKDATGSNLLKSLPIIVVWSLLWTVLIIIDAMVSQEENEGPDKLTFEAAARTLSGDTDGFTLSRAFFSLLSKAVRMTVFLILPSIAWEGSGPAEAFKRGLAALRAHLAEFATGFVSSELISLVIFFPVAILLTFVDAWELALSNRAWTILIAYIAFAWSFSLYIEQMFSAELYLWHLKWARAAEEAGKRNSQPPALSDVRRPSLLDGIPEFAS